MLLVIVALPLLSAAMSDLAAARARATSPLASISGFDINRALALEALHLKSAAIAAWNRYLQLDPSSSWREEVHDRLRQLQAVESRSSWNESGLPVWELLDKGDETGLSAMYAAFPERFRDLFEERVLVELSSSRLSQPTLPITQTWHLRAIRLAALLTGRTGDRSFAEIVERLDSGSDADDALAAPAHQRFAEGRAAYRRDAYDVAERLFASALGPLQRIHSPLALWARHYQATSRFLATRDAEPAIREMGALIERGSRRGYPLLVARSHWIKGLVPSDSESDRRVFQSYDAALRIYTDVGDRSNVASLHFLLAEVFAYMGDHESGWRHRMKALRGLSGVYEARRQQSILSEAALAATNAGLDVVALRFLDELLDRNRSWQRVGAHIEALLTRARTRARLGDPEAAADLDKVRDLLRQINDVRLHGRLERRVAYRAAEILSDRDPPRAVEAVDAALASEASADDRPELLLMRAQAHLRMNEWRSAERDLIDALTAVNENRHQRTQTSIFEWSYVGSRWATYEQLARLYADQGRAWEGLALIEAARSGHSLTATDLQSRAQSLNGRAEVIVFSVLPHGVLTWRVTATTATYRFHHIDRVQLRRNVAAFLDALDAGDDDMVKEWLELFFATLLKPILSEPLSSPIVFVVPDDCLGLLPFHALRDASSGRFLLERHEIRLVLSLNGALHLRSDPPPMVARASNGTYIVGNPTFSASEFPGLRQLPGSEREARAIAATYPVARLQLREGATRDAFLRDAPSARVVHVGAHAIVHPTNAGLSHLVLAPSRAGVSGAVFADDIARLDWSSTEVAVLAACQAGRGAVAPGFGVFSLARPFLDRGTRVVVAALTRIDDEVSTTFFSRVHARLASGRAVQDALRSVQLEFLTRFGLRRQGRVWASVVAISR